jgi:predicted xylose isomerase-like sugar epimerase
MFSNLSPGALGLSLDHPTDLDLAAKHGFGGVDADLGYFRSLGSVAAVAEHAAAVREKGLEWGMAGLADAGIRRGLEYIGPKTFWSLERFPSLRGVREARELIAETGARNVGLILDSYHWYTAGESVEDLAGLTDADIVSVDLNDARADRERDEQQDLDRRLPFATGVIDLEGFMGAVHAAGYTGPVKVEPFMKELADQPVHDVLADISGRVDRAVTGSSAAA